MLGNGNSGETQSIIPRPTEHNGPNYKGIIFTRLNLSLCKSSWK